MRRGSVLTALQPRRPARVPPTAPGPFDELDARARIIAQEQVPVQVDVIAERSDAAAGRDPEAGLEHAPEHHAETQRARSMCHPDRLPNPPGLRELDVDAVRDPCAALDVGQDVAVLVHVDRDRRALSELGATLVAVPAEAARSTRRRARRAAAARRPPLRTTTLVDVDLNRKLGDPAHRANALDVEPVSAPELELQPPEAGAAFSARRAMSSGSPSHTVHEVGGP